MTVRNQHYFLTDFGVFPSYINTVHTYTVHTATVTKEHL